MVVKTIFTSRLVPYRGNVSNRWLMLSLTQLHRALLRLTRGRVGSRLGSMPVIELITRGRRTGESRSALLTVAVRDGDRLVIVASRGGDDAHPAWFLNLEADPRVQVGEPGRPARPMRARIADVHERERLWPLVVAAYRGYAGYQRRTDRVIPLVLLEPEPHDVS